MASSEPPFDRHGEAAPSEDAPLEHELSGSPRELLFQVAHRRLDEWRQWRRIAEETALVDPLDLNGRNHVDSPLIVPFELDADPTKSEDEDLTGELGFSVAVHTATGELEGEGLLEVTDTAYEEYEVTWTPPGGSTAGPAVTLTAADLHDVDGGEATPTVVLRSDDSRYYLELELRHDWWMVLWLRRKLPFYLDPDVARYTVLVPDIELPAGRGE